MTVGWRVVLLYVVAYFLLPSVGQYVFSAEIESIYLTDAVGPMLAIGACGVAATALLMNRLRLFDGTRIFHAVRPLAGALARLYAKMRLPFAFAAVALSIGLQSLGLNAYRYTDYGMTASDSSLTLLASLAGAIISADLSTRMFGARRAAAGLAVRVGDVLLALALLLAVNGTAATFMAVVSTIWACMPAQFDRLVFPSETASLWMRLRHQVVVVISAVVVFGSAWLTGEAIKATSSGDLSLGSAYQEVVHRVADSETVRSYLLYVLEALSSHYHSAAFVTSVDYADLQYQDQSPIVHPVSSLVFRIGYLVGLLDSGERPDVGSLSRLNYLLAAKLASSERAGTSPGVLASFVYVAGFWLGVPLAGVFLQGVAVFLTALFCKPAVGSWSGIAMGLMLLVCLPIFQSPFDLLILVDNTSLYVACLVAFTLAPYPATMGLGAKQAVRSMPLVRPGASKAELAACDVVEGRG